MMPARTAYPTGANVNSDSTKFTKSFLEQKRRQLIALRAALKRALDSQAKEEKAIQGESGEAHEFEDEGQKLAMLELDQNLANRTATRLAHVERALQKIDEGTYGVSDAGGGFIPTERLDAVPEAIYTLEEQQARDPAP
jgi:DnaK suppressor protein